MFHAAGPQRSELAPPATSVRKVLRPYGRASSGAGRSMSTVFRHRQTWFVTGDQATSRKRIIRATAEEGELYEGDRLPEVRLTRRPRAKGDRDAGGQGRSGARQSSSSFSQSARLAQHEGNALPRARKRGAGQAEEHRFGSRSGWTGGSRR